MDRKASTVWVQSELQDQSKLLAEIGRAAVETIGVHKDASLQIKFSFRGSASSLELKYNTNAHAEFIGWAHERIAETSGHLSGWSLTIDCDSGREVASTARIEIRQTRSDPHFPVVVTASKLQVPISMGADFTEVNRCASWPYRVVVDYCDLEEIKNKLQVQLTHSRENAVLKFISTESVIRRAGVDLTAASCEVFSYQGKWLDDESFVSTSSDISLEDLVRLYDAAQGVQHGFAMLSFCEGNAFDPRRVFSSLGSAPYWLWHKELSMHGVASSILSWDSGLPEDTIACFGNFDLCQVDSARLATGNEKSVYGKQLIVLPPLQ